MTNKHLSQSPSALVKAKLSVLLDSVNSMYNTKSMTLESDITSAYHDAINIFFESLDGSITGSSSVISPGDPSDPSEVNAISNAISRDLSVLFSELGALDKIVTSSFNSITASREQVLQRSRRIADKIDDYKLYSDPSTGAGYFFGDSFNSSENIELGSSLVETDECFLGQDEGIVLLPLDGSPDKPQIKSYIVNDTSNGTFGNNVNTTVSGKDDMSALGDGEPNTWVEYDKVSSYDNSTEYKSKEPLILDFNIVLKDPSVINHIHFNPINFGTPTPVRIVKLETSKDGIEYRSIRDEVPLKDFLPEDEDEVFTLSPSTSKYAGQGFYSFLPRKAQYIHVVLEQHTPYTVETSNGNRLRYAIGIRDINIYGRKFKSEGSIVSVPFSTDNDIRKLSLWASENPIQASELSDITHSVSHDDGSSWYKLQPTTRDAFNTEVLNFNNVAPGSLSTDAPVTSLRHKIYMNRNSDAFDGNVTIKEEKVTKIDIIDVPIGGEPKVSTSEKPIADTFRAVLPFWGSYSCPRPRAGSAAAGESFYLDRDRIDFNVDVPAIDTLRFDLPYKNFDSIRDHIRVFVNGEQIEYANKTKEYMLNPSDTSYGDTTLDDTSKVYFLNKNGTELQFGFVDSGTRYGFLPPSGARVSVILDGDNPRLELTDQGYVLNLSSSSDGQKENVDLICFKNMTSNEAKDFSMELPRGKRKIITPFAAGARADAQLRSDYASSSAATAKANAEAQRLATLAPEARSAYLGNLGKGETARASAGTAKKSAEREAQARRMEFDRDVNIDRDGIFPPVFLDDINSISIQEWDGNNLVTGNTWIAKEFIDGEQELKDQTGPDGAWVYQPFWFSFDAYSGTVHIGGDTSSTNKTIFTCKKVDATIVKPNEWEFYRDPVKDRLDTSRIVLRPESVMSLKKNVTVSTGEKSISLTDNSTSHDWFNQRVVKGTVQVDPLLFGEGSLPTEVPFIDGSSELTDRVYVDLEQIDFGTPVGDIYTFDLKNISDSHVLIGIPGFGVIRDPKDPSTPENAFQAQVFSIPSLQGQWSISGSTVSLKWSGSLSEHTVTYEYNNVDPGIDYSGLYSVDYDSGVLHLANPSAADSSVNLEVSLYSAFYNIAEVIKDGDIVDVDEEGQSITFSDYLGMRFLKMNTAEKARPQYMKLMYEYYKRSTESIKDLEPYFSPICKDVAFRAVTSDIIEEL